MSRALPLSTLSLFRRSKVNEARQVEGAQSSPPMPQDDPPDGWDSPLVIAEPQGPAEAPLKEPPAAPAESEPPPEVGTHESSAELELRVHLLEFGPRAVLRPEPNVVTPQSLRLEDHVSDTELDGARVGACEVRAVSVRGHAHRWEGEVRQDSFALGLNGDRLLLAVADGVGSASASHVGSNTAVREAVREALDPTSVISRARQAVHDAAIMRSLEPRSVSTTIVVAEVPAVPDLVEGQSTWTVTLSQLGDSPAVRLRFGEWEFLRPPGAAAADAGELTNSAVEALPLSGKATTWTETFLPGDVLLLVTDGVSNLATANSEYRDAIASLFADHTPSMAELLRVVDATVKSFDDDRTLVAHQFRSEAN